MIPKRWNLVFRSDFPKRQHPYGGDPHRGSALNSGALVGTFHADRSKPGGLAIRCCIGDIWSLSRPLSAACCRSGTVGRPPRSQPCCSWRSSCSGPTTHTACRCCRKRSRCRMRRPRRPHRRRPRWPLPRRRRGRKIRSRTLRRAIRSPMSRRRLQRQRLLRRPLPQRPPPPARLASSRHWCFS